jgi:Tol biopolymer transport system component
LPTPVTVYTVSTGELHQLGSVEAGNLTWSPDGTTIAFTRVSRVGSGEAEHDSTSLWLVDADGTNERRLTAAYSVMHGIGPVWSPAGDRIAYQRSQQPLSGERHEVVLVSVADGNQTVIEPPRTDGPMPWYPYSVTWSPDGTTLLYTAWGQSPHALIAVPADTPSDATELTDSIEPSVGHTERWMGTQMWGRQPE